MLFKRFFVISLVFIISLLMVPNGVEANFENGLQAGIILEVDGEDYYFAGPPIAEDSNKLDVPGHEWVSLSSTIIYGKHYNTGPFGAERWWSSDADNGELLYSVLGIIDGWSESKAERYAEMGYVHYHELVSVEDGELHPDKIVWLKHLAKNDFTFDGGPHPEMGSHEVTAGLDTAFMPNYTEAYAGAEADH